MDVDDAILQANDYEARRPRIRETLIAFLREHIDQVVDESLRRKIRRYPGDLSDIRMADLVVAIQVKLGVRHGP